MGESTPAIVFILNNDEQIIGSERLTDQNNYFNILQEGQRNDMCVSFKPFCPRTGYKFSGVDVYDYTVTKAYEKRLLNIDEESVKAKAEAKIIFDEMAKIKFVVQ